MVLESYVARLESGVTVGEVGSEIDNFDRVEHISE